MYIAGLGHTDCDGLVLEATERDLFHRRFFDSSPAGDLAYYAIQVCGHCIFVKELAHNRRQYPLEGTFRDSKSMRSMRAAMCNS